MIHESAHDIATDGSHVHGEEFYRNYHNLCQYGTIGEGDSKPGGANRELEVFCERMKNAVKQEAADEAAEKDKKAKARIVADYIAGMSDRYAMKEHERLFSLYGDLG